VDYLFRTMSAVCIDCLKDKRILHMRIHQDGKTVALQFGLSCGHWKTIVSCKQRKE